MELRTDKIRACFDRKIGNFTELWNLSTNTNYVRCAPRDPLIELYGLKNGERIKLPGRISEVEEAPDALILRYDSFGEYDISAKVTCRCEQDRLVFSAEICNHSTIDVTEILMPHLGGIYLGNGQNDYLIYPHHAGDKTEDPVYNYAENRMTFWRGCSVPFEDIYRREINYCGLASMSWMYYYNSCGGVYIGSHDPRFPVTGVIAETSGDRENPWMAFAFRKYFRIKQGETYQTGDYVVCLSDKDWHYGSKVYREYIAPYLDFDHNPEYLQNEYALNQCYNFKRTGKVEHTFKDIPAMFEAGKAWGARHMFIASWNRTGFDSFYPEYYPDMELGSAMEFRRGLEYVRNHSGMSTLYINARIFDLKSDFHKLVGEKMAMRNEKGEMYRETYGPEHFTVNCPSDALWREYLLDTAEFCVKAYGCDGIYLDQLASAEPFPCYCSEHTHDNIGEFNNGYVYVLKNLLERLRTYNPNAYIMTENCGDIYGSYTWGNLTWNGAEYDEHYNVFKYTFPEFTQVNMVNPRSWAEEKDRPEWFRKDLHRAITLGSILWLGITSRLRPEDGAYHDYGMMATAFRGNLQPLLKHAQYLDDLWLENVPNQCFASCWALENGEKLVILANDSTQDVSFRIKDLHGSIVKNTKSMDTAIQDSSIIGTDPITITVPQGQLSYFLLQ